MKRLPSKIWAWIRWAAMMVVAALGAITAPIIYPLAYVFKGTPLRPLFVLYYDNEDNDGCSPAVDWFNHGKCNFWIRYRWSALRNPAWGLHQRLKPRSGEITVVDYSGQLWRDMDEMPVLAFAVLKYVDADGKYQDNKGEYLSLRHSIFGRMMCWYQIDGRGLYFRYSTTGKPLSFWANFFECVSWLIRLIWWPFSRIFKNPVDLKYNRQLWWYEIQAGTNDHRYTLRIKIKRNETYEIVIMF